MKGFRWIVFIVFLFLTVSCQVFEKASSGVKTSKMMTKEEERMHKPVLPEDLFLTDENENMVFREVLDSSYLSSSDYHDMYEYLNGLDDKAEKLINEDDTIVVDNGKLMTGLESLEDFLIKVGQNQRKSLSFVSLTGQGDPVIDLFLFDGIRFYGIHDSTRNSLVMGRQFEYEFLYLKRMETDDEIIYMLVNNEAFTDGELLEAIEEKTDKLLNGFVLLRYRR